MFIFPNFKLFFIVFKMPNYPLDEQSFLVVPNIPFDVYFDVVYENHGMLVSLILGIFWHHHFTLITWTIILNIHMPTLFLTMQLF